MSRAVVLLNDLAGRGRANERHRQVRTLAAQFGIEIQGASSPEEMEGRARELALSGVERVIAAGGDGTVNRVMNGVAGTRAALGIIPCGSGNDLAINLGISIDTAEAFASAINDPAREVDLCRIDPPGRYYACIASFGLDSLANRIANQHRGPFRGTSLYVWSLLRALWEFTPVRVTIAHDGGEYRNKILLLVAANAASYGGGMRIAPNAELHDGLLDVVAVERMTRLKLLWCFPEVFSGKHISRKEVAILRSRTVSIDAERPLEIFADGEYVGRTPATVSVLPNALRVIAPAK